MATTPPDYVLEAFGVSGSPQRAGRAWDNGWVYESLVLSEVRSPAQAMWSAKVRSLIDIDGVAVASSVRASDGRQIIAGWQARHFVPGALAPRADETIVLAGRIDAALESVSRPQFLVDQNPGLFLTLDRAAWAADPIAILEKLLDPGSIPRADCAEALTTAGELLSLRQDLVVPAQQLQVCHADVVGTLLYDGTATPVLTDIVPAWHPQGWTAALAAVDSVAMMGADEGLLRRFDHVDDFAQLLVRAMLFRLFVHAVHPQSQPGAHRGLARAASLVRAFVSQ